MKAAAPKVAARRRAEAPAPGPSHSRTPEGQREAAPSSLNDLIGFQLRRAHTQFALHWQQFFRDRPIRITPVQGGILLAIESRPGLSQTALAGIMDVEGPTIVQVLDRMEASGLILRVRRATDRRSYALVLTEAGNEAIAAVKEVVPFREAELLGDLTEDERVLLLHLLKRVVNRAHAVTDVPGAAAQPD